MPSHGTQHTMRQGLLAGATVTSPSPTCSTQRRGLDSAGRRPWDWPAADAHRQSEQSTQWAFVPLSPPPITAVT